MIIEDFVMLGRTVPEYSKKHGMVACSAGYSREYGGFLRIYPLSVDCSIPRWTVCRVSVESPKDDNRVESFRIKDGFAPEKIAKVKKDQEFDFLQSLQSRSIASLNQDRHSLAIIKPKNLCYRYDKMKEGEEYQLCLPFYEQEKKETLKPRLQFSDEDGLHDLQLRDWGCFQFLKKKYDKRKLWSALFLTNPEYEHILFCGNHNSHRNSWLVISLISRKIQANRCFDF